MVDLEDQRRPGLEPGRGDRRRFAGRVVGRVGANRQFAGRGQAQERLP
jgi:hypothetical protein